MEKKLVRKNVIKYQGHRLDEQFALTSFPGSEEHGSLQGIACQHTSYPLIVEEKKQERKEEKKNNTIEIKMHNKMSKILIKFTPPPLANVISLCSTKI